MGPVLRFRLFNMPVTVRASFLLVAALIGFIGRQRVAETVAWIVIVFVSILIHELGHAFTARMYGSQVAIELNGLGGLTRWSVSPDQLTPGRRALIAAAGSAVGIVFGGLVWLIASQFGPYRPLTAFILENTIWVNVFWGLVNWLPVRPLDGGHLLQSLLEKTAPKRAPQIARVVFIATAAAALLVAIQLRFIFIAVLAGWLLLAEFSTGRTESAPTGLPTLSYDDASSSEGEEVAEADASAATEEPEDTTDPPH